MKKLLAILLIRRWRRDWSTRELNISVKRLMIVYSALWTGAKIESGGVSC
jgi:hypothetical protein